MTNEMFLADVEFVKVEKKLKNFVRHPFCQLRCTSSKVPYFNEVMSMYASLREEGSFLYFLYSHWTIWYLYISRFRFIDLPLEFNFLWDRLKKFRTC